ncbi:hypothetical protein ACGE0T_10025 [Parabacteroides sp. APC149_11_2_Y6]
MSTRKKIRKVSLFAFLGFICCLFIWFYSEKRKYLINGECRYTVATCKYTNNSPTAKSLFYFEVNGKQYPTIASTVKVKYPVYKPTRLLIKYSVKNPNWSEVVKCEVPSWVSIIPENGWEEYPPAINWDGTVLDAKLK